MIPRQLRSRFRNGVLLQVLGTGFGVAAVAGTSIGQGILRTPGQVAAELGTPGLIMMVWLGCGIFAMIEAMSTVELAASIRRTGGPYIFLRRTFGATAGYLAGLATTIAHAGVLGYIAIVFGEYLQRLGFFSGVATGIPAVLAIGTVCTIQAVGTFAAGISQKIGSALKVFVFLALIGLLMSADPRPAPPPVASVVTPFGLILAIRLVHATYLGWNSATYFVEEYADPARSVVRATFVGIALVTLLYVLFNFALLRVLHPDEMAGSTLVAADALKRLFGDQADMIMNGISLALLATTLNMAMMAFPRLLFAMARDAAIPGLSSTTLGGTPLGALVAMGIGSSLLAATGIYTTLLAFSTWLMTGAAIAVHCAALTLRVREPQLERPYRMPLFPLPILVALAINGTLMIAYLYEQPFESAKATLWLMICGIGLYAFQRYRKYRDHSKGVT